MRDILALTGRSHAIALDGLGEDDRRLSLVPYGRGVGRARRPDLVAARLMSHLGTLGGMQPAEGRRHLFIERLGTQAAADNGDLSINGVVFSCQTPAKGNAIGTYADEQAWAEAEMDVQFATSFNPANASNLLTPRGTLAMISR